MADVFAITELGIDVMFYGGMQIDRHGCVNVHYVATPRGRLRGPGMANTTLGHTARRTLLFTERHDRRTLVDQVDFASVIGHRYRGRSRRELELPNDGPAALFTPQLVMRPDAGGVLQPAHVIGDGSLSDAIDAVGWAVQDTRPNASSRPRRRSDSSARSTARRCSTRSEHAAQRSDRVDAGMTEWRGGMNHPDRFGIPADRALLRGAGARASGARVRPPRAVRAVRREPDAWRLRPRVQRAAGRDGLGRYDHPPAVRRERADERRALSRDLGAAWQRAHLSVPTGPPTARPRRASSSTGPNLCDRRSCRRSPPVDA